MNEPAGAASIRRRLLLSLVGALVVMVAGAGAVTYWVALRSANSAYDRSLLDPAVEIAEALRVDAEGAHLDLPPQVVEALVYDQVDRVVYQVRSPTGEIVAGDASLPPPPDLGRDPQRFFDSASAGEPVRVAAHRADGGYVVQVGETLHKRSRLAREILVAELAPTVLVAAVAVALAWFGVARGLRPLEELRADLLRRAPNDLHALPATAAPVEIAPVVKAFNRLLGAVRDASTMQQRFLANAAHQLRTPLAGLQMHLELLLRRDLGDDVRAEVERMHGATVRASRLANQLLALAKAEGASEQARAFEPVDLAAVAGAAALDWAPRAHAQGIDLGFALVRAEIRGDPLLLPELVDNLLDNALRYTPAGGTVTVTTGADETGPFLCVDDTGPGIPVAERTKVLERFYRIPGTAGEGSGLGLAIVQEVLARHRGVLEIASADDLRGARMRVRFPAPAPLAS